MVQRAKSHPYTNTFTRTPTRSWVPAGGPPDLQLCNKVIHPYYQNDFSRCGLRQYWDRQGGVILFASLGSPIIVTPGSHALILGKSPSVAPSASILVQIDPPSRNTCSFTQGRRLLSVTSAIIPAFKQPLSNNTCERTVVRSHLPVDTATSCALNPLLSRNMWWGNIPQGSTKEQV